MGVCCSPEGGLHRVWPACADEAKQSKTHGFKVWFPTNSRSAFCAPFTKVQGVSGRWASVSHGQRLSRYRKYKSIKHPLLCCLVIKQKNGESFTLYWGVGEIDKL
jgi:hypothetical protein